MSCLTGGLVVLGLVYNLFPKVEVDESNPLKVDTADASLSKRLKRLGLRLGAGSTVGEGEVIIGTGIQVRAISVGGL